MNDVITGGMAVDIRSGKPRDRGPTEKEKLSEAQLEAEASAGMEAEQKLKTKAGRLFVAMIEKELQRRIEELVNVDPQAMAFLRLLDNLGYDIQVGEAAAKRLTRIRLGRQAREIPNIE
jgi:hypothetical protein